jgi:hypothetical protein
VAKHAAALIKPGTERPTPDDELADQQAELNAAAERAGAPWWGLMTLWVQLLSEGLRRVEASNQGPNLRLLGLASVIDARARRLEHEFVLALESMRRAGMASNAEEVMEGYDSVLEPLPDLSHRNLALAPLAAKLPSS